MNHVTECLKNNLQWWQSQNRRYRSFPLYVIIVTFLFFVMMGLLKQFSTLQYFEYPSPIIQINQDLTLDLEVETSSESDSGEYNDLTPNLNSSVISNLTLTRTGPLEIEKLFPYIFAGYDLEQRPVWIVPFGKWNVRQQLEKGGKNEEILENYLQQFSHRVDQSRGQSQWVLICDMTDYTYSQLTSMATTTFLLRLASTFQNNPESMAYGFVVNLDWISNMLIRIVRPILGHSLDKMFIFGIDKDDYVTSILSKISSRQLPYNYGGPQVFTPVASFG